MNTRTLDLWDLVCWVYRDQKAHIYLRKTVDWFDWAIDMTTHGEIDVNVPVHPDAAMVHAAVLLLGYMDAFRIFEHAVSGNRPEISTATPRPYPLLPSDGVLRNDDRASWDDVAGRRQNYTIRTDEKIWALNLVLPRARFKGHKPSPIERRSLVPVEYCPIEWSPTPEFTDMVNSIYSGWTEAMVRLRLNLEEQKLHDHRISGFDFDLAPSFLPPDPNMGKRDPDVIAEITPLQGFAEGVTWVEAGSDLTPVPWRYRKVVRSTVVKPAA